MEQLDPNAKERRVAVKAGKVLGEAASGNAYVRGDAAATENSTAGVGRVDRGRAVVVGGAVAMGDVVDKALVVALDGPARGGVIARGGQSEAGVTNGVNRLDEPLAPGNFAHDQPAVVVLNCAGDDFRSRGGALVDEDYERSLEGLGAARRGEGGVALRRTASGSDDEVILTEECIRDSYRGIERSTWVCSDVEDQALHPLCLEEIDGLVHLANTAAGELG